MNHNSELEVSIYYYNDVFEQCPGFGTTMILSKYQWYHTYCHISAYDHFAAN